MSAEMTAAEVRAAAAKIESHDGTVLFGSRPRRVVVAALREYADRMDRAARVSAEQIREFAKEFDCSACVSETHDDCRDSDARDFLTQAADTEEAMNRIVSGDPALVAKVGDLARFNDATVARVFRFLGVVLESERDREN